MGDLQRIVDRVLAILSRRRWLFVLPLLTGLLGTLAVALFVPRLYTLSAMLERRDDPVLTELIQNNSPFSFVPQRRSLVVDLLNQQAAAGVLEEAGLLGEAVRDEAGQLTPAAQARLQGYTDDIMPDIRVKLTEKGPELDIIELRYTGQYPELGALMINGLKDRYATAIQARIDNVYQQSHSFFQSLAQQKGKETAVLQVEVAQMLAKYPGISPSNPHELDDLLVRANHQVEDLTLDQEELRDRIAYYEEHLRLLEREIPTTQPFEGDEDAAMVWLPNPRRSELAQSIEQLKKEMADARDVKKMTDLHPTMQALQSQMQRLQIEYQSEPARVEHIRSLEATPVAGFNPRTSESERNRAEMELASLRKKLDQKGQELADVQTNIAVYQRQLEDLSERRDAYIALKRKLDRAQADFGVWNRHVGELERVITADSQDRGIHFRTVYQASVPGRPFSPTVFGVFALAAGIGLGLAVAAVFLRDMFDRSIRNPNRVRESLGIPVLETIGEIHSAPSAGAIAHRVLIRGCAVLQAFLIVSVGTLVYLSLAQPAAYQKVMTAMSPLLSG
jgi:uncharacterized protein involved in exopolysaccharide biosynthesis